MAEKGLVHCTNHNDDISAIAVSCSTFGQKHDAVSCVIKNHCTPGHNVSTQDAGGIQCVIQTV